MSWTLRPKWLNRKRGGRDVAVLISFLSSSPRGRLAQGRVEQHFAHTGALGHVPVRLSGLTQRKDPVDDRLDPALAGARKGLLKPARLLARLADDLELEQVEPPDVQRHLDVARGVAGRDQPSTARHRGDDLSEQLGVGDVLADQVGAM